MEEISEKGTIQIIVCTVIHVILWHRNYLPIELKDCVFITHINTGTCTDSKTTCIFFSSLKYVSWRLPQLWLKTWRHQHAHEHNIYVTQFEDFCPLHWSSHHSFPDTSWQTWKKKPPHLILLLPGTLSAILCMHDLRRNQYQMYLIRYAAMLLLKTNLYIG